MRALHSISMQQMCSWLTKSARLMKVRNTGWTYFFFFFGLFLLSAFEHYHFPIPEFSRTIGRSFPGIEMISSLDVKSPDVIN